MKITIAPDSFKSYLNSRQVVNLISLVLKSIDPEINVEGIPLSDGGEGALQIFASQPGSKLERAQTTDPLGQQVIFNYVLFPQKKTGILESASIIGYELISSQQRNPHLLSTWGLGTALKLLFNKHPSWQWLLTLGGSATIDCGKDIVQGLGFDLGLPPHNRRGPDSLSAVKYIKPTATIEAMRQQKVKLICDVDNYLLGKEGAIRTYGPQKGVKPNQIPFFENQIQTFTQILNQTSTPFIDQPGYGAAGGIPATLNHLFHWPLVSGSEYFAQLTNLEANILNSDLVISGEGKFDSQSRRGKITNKVIELAHKHNIPALIIAGTSDNNSCKLPDNIKLLLLDPPGSKPPDSANSVKTKLLSKTLKYLKREIKSHKILYKKYF